MDYKIFLIQIILVFSQVYGQEVASAREEEEPNLFTSAELRDEFQQDLDEINEELASLGEKDSDGTCDNELKGDGQCDEVNDKAKCDWDYGDCCKKNWFGNGRCNARNNFTGCTNNAGTDQFWGTIDAYKNDGGDCFPRECFMNEDDPLNVAYTTKYGEFWYNNLNTSIDDVDVLDPQNFFPEITKQNECRALNCLFSDQSEGSTFWEFTYLSCDTKDSDGSDYDSLGPGCYCQVGYTLVTNKKCCFYKNCEDDPLRLSPCAFKDSSKTWGRTMKRKSGRNKRFRGKKRG